MIDPHALRTLIEQWRDFSTKPIGVNCAAGYDGITATLSKCADDLEALLSALPETPWQPISTAPIEGRFLATDGRGRMVVMDGHIYSLGLLPEVPHHLSTNHWTHWMPLPAPPPPSEETT